MDSQGKAHERGYTLIDVRILHSITEPTKFKILQLLMQHNYCVHALSLKMEMSDSAISQQLNVLKKLGIVSGQRLGYQMHYQVNHVSIMKEIKDFLCYFEENKGDNSTSSSECMCEYSSTCVRYHKDKGTC